jgi:hypothetical protein
VLDQVDLSPSESLLLQEMLELRLDGEADPLVCLWLVGLVARFAAVTGVPPARRGLSPGALAQLEERVDQIRKSGDQR